MSSAERTARLDRRGFTMIELMVALVILALLTTALWQIVRSQTRWAAFETQREDAADNARASVDLLVSDLRSAIPNGLINASDSVLVLALPKAWGVVCSTTGNTQMVAVFPGVIPAATITTVAANGGTGLTANIAATSAATPTWSPRPSTSGGSAQVTSVVAANLAACGNAGASAGGGASALQAYTITGTGFPSPSQGAAVMLYDLVKYDLGQSEGQWWLRRSNGYSGSGNFSMQPLAGPLAAHDSLKFSYYSGAAASLVAAPGTSTSGLDSLSRVKVKVVTQSSSGQSTVGGATQYSRDRDSAVVLLRNRITSIQCSTGIAGALC